MSGPPPPFTPRKRRMVRGAGIMVVIGAVAALAWWSSGDLTGRSPAWPIASISGLVIGAILLLAAAQGRQLAMFPGNPAAEWRRVSLIRSVGTLIALVVLCVLVPLGRMSEPRLPTPWWWWLVWALALVALPFAFRRARRLRQECREDDRVAGG
jgi:hypothetical protein